MDRYAAELEERERIMRALQDPEASVREEIESLRDDDPEFREAADEL